MTFILILLQVLLLLLIVKLMRRPAVSPVLSTALLVLAVIWYVAPVLINTLFWSSVAYQSEVGYDLFVSYATLETLVLLLTLTILLRKKPYFQTITDSAPARASLSPTFALLVVLFSIGTTMIFTVMAGDLLGGSYYERNAFAVAEEGTAVFNNLGSFQFVQIMLTCFGYACLLTKWPQRSKTRLLYLVILAWLGVSILFQLLQGARIGLITPLMLLVLYGRVRQWTKRKMMLVVAAPAAVMLVVGSVLVITIPQDRLVRELTLQSTVSRSVELIREEGSATKLVEPLLIQIVTKFDSFSTGAFLVRREGAGVAGWVPYHGAILSLVPRALLASKPIPGSADGTFVGHPSRLVAERLGMDLYSGNVNVSPAAISIWQLGYLGLIGMVLVNAIHLQLINSLLLSQSIPLKSLGLYLIGIPTMLTLFTTPDSLIMNIERVILVYVFLWVADRMVKNRYHRSNHLPNVTRWPVRAGN